jgi:hypothetical protein
MTVAYKGFDKDLKCRGFQYEIGKTYKLEENEEPALCLNGFHYCTSPAQLLAFYPPYKGSRYCLVKPGGITRRSEDGDKLVCSEITILEEMSFKELIEHAAKKSSHQSYEKVWLANKVQTDDTVKGAVNEQQQRVPYSSMTIIGAENKQINFAHEGKQVAIGGGNEQFSSQTYTSQFAHGTSNHQYSSGNYCTQIVENDFNTQFSYGVSNRQYAKGDSCIQLLVGSRGIQKVTGEYGLSVNTSYEGRVMLGKNGTAVLFWFDENFRRRATVLYEGENGIKAGVWYELNGKGEVICSPPGKMWM